MSESRPESEKGEQNWSDAQGIFIRLPEADTREALGLFTALDAVLRFRWLVLLTMLVLVGLGIVVILFATPMYESTAAAIPVTEDEQRGGLGGLVGQFSGLASLTGISLGESGGLREEAVARLKSRALAHEFIERYQLMPVLFAEYWDEEAGAWMVAEDEEAPSTKDGIRLFHEEVLRVADDQTSGLVSVTIRWHDRYKTEAWANAYLHLLNEIMRNEKIEQAEKSIAFLEAELQKTSIVGVQQTIYGLLETHINTIMMANVREQFALTVIDPAMVPEREEAVWPRRLPLLAGSLVLGFVIGVLAALVLDRVRPVGARAGDTH